MYSLQTLHRQLTEVKVSWSHSIIKAPDGSPSSASVVESGSESGAGGFFDPVPINSAQAFFGQEMLQGFDTTLGQLGIIYHFKR
jgi:hypothetical protein